MHLTHTLLPAAESSFVVATSNKRSGFPRSTSERRVLAPTSPGRGVGRRSSMIRLFENSDRFSASASSSRHLKPRSTTKRSRCSKPCARARARISSSASETRRGSSPATRYTDANSLARWLVSWRAWSFTGPRAERARSHGLPAAPESRPPRGKQAYHRG